MKGITISNVTPQQKMVAVNNKFGNKNIANQQGSTRTIYSSLPLDGRTNFRFFENATQQAFPLTNIGSEGNRLEVGSTFTIQKVYFVFLIYDAVNNTITAANNSSIFVAGDVRVPFATAELDIFIANSQVIKQLPTHFNEGPTFNSTALNTTDYAFSFNTDIVIPPLLEYVANLRTTSYDVAALSGHTHLMCVLQGSAGIIAPQTTF